MSAFEQPVWGICESLVWIAVRTKAAVDDAGAGPGTHHGVKIDNTTDRQHDFQSANAMMRAALLAGDQLVATGCRNGGGREVIDAWRWGTLEFDLTMSSAVDRHAEDQWRDVALARAQMFRLWPDVSPPSAEAISKGREIPQSEVIYPDEPPEEMNNRHAPEQDWPFVKRMRVLIRTRQVPSIRRAAAKAIREAKVIPGGGSTETTIDRLRRIYSNIPWGTWEFKLPEYYHYPK